MQYYHKNFSSRILSFIGFGISLVLIFIGFILFSYILIIGAIVGLILFGISSIINFFRAPNTIGQHRPPQDPEQQRELGRTFDHDDL